jgi:hypothetical protein
VKARRRRPRRIRRAAAKGKGKLALIPAWIAHPVFSVLIGTNSELGQLLLATAAQEYARNRQPLYAWHAYQQARILKVPPPDWVMTYLDAVAAQLWRLAENPPKDPARSALEALQFKHLRGRGNVFDIAAQAADWLLASEADYEDSLGKKGAQVVAERHKVSISTVYRARSQRG